MTEKKDPAPIPVITAPATVVPPPVELPKPAQVGDANVAPTTTAAEDKVPEGQRRINLIWEKMQATIAGLIVFALVLVSSVLSLLAVLPNATERQLAIAVTAFMLLGQLGGVVIGFYFGRTNHAKSGGVGGSAVKSDR